MRFSAEKVKDLARQIVDMMQEHPQVRIQSSTDALRVAIGSVILDDLREEDEIEREADALIVSHSREIEEQDLDVTALRQKFKREIARQRGFVI